MWCLQWYRLCVCLDRLGIGGSRRLWRREIRFPHLVLLAPATALLLCLFSRLLLVYSYSSLFLLPLFYWVWFNFLFWFWMLMFDPFLGGCWILFLFLYLSIWMEIRVPITCLGFCLRSSCVGIAITATGFSGVLRFDFDLHENGEIKECMFHLVLNLDIFLLLFLDSWFQHFHLVGVSSVIYWFPALICHFWWINRMILRWFLRDLLPSFCLIVVPLLVDQVFLTYQDLVRSTLYFSSVYSLHHLELSWHHF